MALLIKPRTLPEALPRSIYESIPLADAENAAGSFTIVTGLDKEMVADLKRHSLDTGDIELMKGTGDYRRFGLGEFEAWFAKERYAFALVDSGNHLAALMWFGPESAPSEITIDAHADEWDTLAFRSYEPYRGKGIMTDFSRFVLETYARLRPGRKSWLETNADNEAAKHLYEKLGFISYGIRENNSRLVMAK